jgi:hypothetical protein
MAGIGMAASLACYRFDPATFETVPEGSTVRALLSPSANDQVRARHNVQGPTLGGTVMPSNGQTLSLWVASAPTTSEFGVKPLYQQVDVARSDVLRVDVRRLDIGRTAMVAAAGAAVAVVVGRAAVRGGTGGSGPGGGPGPSESRRGWLLSLIRARF